MAGKGTNMFFFVLALLIAGPLGLISAFLCLAWLWEYITSCFFSLARFCGAGSSIKGFLFGLLAMGCFSAIKATWDKSK